MGKYVRVEIPRKQPDKTIKLCDDIIKKNTAEGVNSTLDPPIDIAAFGLLVTAAKSKRTEAAEKDGEAQDKFDKATLNAGLAKGQTKDTPDAIYWYVVQVRDLLLTLNRGNEEALTPYGFNVVVTQTGARRNVRIDIPTVPADMVDLAEDIVGHHTSLGAGSPLVVPLVDMAAFGALVTATAALLEDWEELRGDVQALNDEVLTILGYGIGQNSYSAGTIYFDLIRIRTRLLQKHTSNEEALSKWGFKVVKSQATPGRKKGSKAVSIKGKVTDSETGNPVPNALVLLVEPDIFTLTDDDGNFQYEKIEAGNYNIQAHKTGYESDPVPIVVVAGQVTNVDIEIVPEAATGSISGNVTKTGAPAMANITVLGHPGGTVTSASGAFSENSIPAGAQTVRAILVDDPLQIIDQPIVVLAGGNVVVNFSFP